MGVEVAQEYFTLPRSLNTFKYIQFSSVAERIGGKNEPNIVWTRVKGLIYSSKQFSRLVCLFVAATHAPETHLNFYLT